MNLRTIQTLNSWPLCIAPAHSRVREGAACYGESRLSGKETPQSGWNHWRVCYAAAEPSLLPARWLFDETMEQWRTKLVYLSPNQEKHLETEAVVQRQHRLKCLTANHELHLAGETVETCCARLQHIAVPVFTSYTACLACKAKVEPKSAKVGYCTKCTMPQFLDKCVKQLSAKIIIQAGTQRKTLQVLCPQLAEICRRPQDQVNTDTVLTAPPCNINFNKRQVLFVVYLYFENHLIFIHKNLMLVHQQ